MSDPSCMHHFSNTAWAPELYFPLGSQAPVMVCMKVKFVLKDISCEMISMDDAVERTNYRKKPIFADVNQHQQSNSFLNLTYYRKY